MLFNIYYHSPKTGDYLQQVVEASGMGRVKDCQTLSNLNGDRAVDVVCLEYQDNDPGLDHWIAQTAAQPQCPEIFLFGQDTSPHFIWKALKLGAREVFPDSIRPEELREALRRVEVRQASLAGQL